MKMRCFNDPLLLNLHLQVKVVGPEGEQTYIEVTVREVSMDRYSIRSKCAPPAETFVKLALGLHLIP